MKRFYCTTCKKVKRVRRLPSLDITSYYHSDDSPEKILQPSPSARLGECHFHNALSKIAKDPLSRNEVNNRLRVTGQRQRKSGVKR